MSETLDTRRQRNDETIELPIVRTERSGRRHSSARPGQLPTRLPQHRVRAERDHYIDGDAGILRYRGYPIEQLATHLVPRDAYLLI